MQHDHDRPALDNKTGPAAVVRNLDKLLTPEHKAQGWRVVAIDRFYTSVSLLLQLLALHMYAVGTIMTNRLGYCKSIIDRTKKRAQGVAKGRSSWRAPWTCRR